MTARHAWVCLLFHDVLPATAAAGGGAERFAVPVQAFGQWLDAIAEAGLSGVSVAGAVAAPGTARAAITFDDGTSSQFEHAAPALRARGMTATFYVITDRVGQPGYMSWDQLRTLRDWGMSIGSHTRSHPFLSELAAGPLRDELAQSKAALDRALGQDTVDLSFPGGNAPRRALRPLLHETGYRRIAGSRWGRNPDGGGGWVRRCTARGDVTPDLAARVVTGDPWLTAVRAPREALLNGVRAVVGPSRYARWRRRVLDRLAGER